METVFLYANFYKKGNGGVAMFNTVDFTYENIITLGNSFKTEIEEEKELQGKDSFFGDIGLTKIIDYQYESILDLETETEIEEHNKYAFETIQLVCGGHEELYDEITSMLQRENIKEGIDVVVYENIYGDTITHIFGYNNGKTTVSKSYTIYHF